MKASLISLSLLALVACSKKGSSHKSPAPAPTPGVEIPGTDDSNPVETPDTGTKPTTPSTPNQSENAPSAGLYIGTCAANGSQGLASGVEVKDTGVYPTIVLFTTPNCEATSLNAFGYTDSYGSWTEYAADVKAMSTASGDETIITSDATGLHSLSTSGVKNDFVRIPASLTHDNRFSVTIDEDSVHSTMGIVTGKADLDRYALPDGSYDIGFYCEDANNKFLRQESSFTVEPGSDIISFKGLMNTWESGQVPSETRCLLTLAVLSKSGETVLSKDVAWSQNINVK